MSLVLVVDDSDVIAVWLSSLLATEGYDVRCVSHDLERLLDPTDPSWSDVAVLFCDLMMPGVPGIDVLRVARDHHPHIRRIALTGAESPLLEQGRELAHETLRKPTGFDDILAAARRVEGLT